MSEAISLKYPIEANGVTVNSLTLRRPTVGDFIKSSQGGRDEQETEIHLFADLCSVSPADIHRIDLADYQQLQDALGKMQDNGHKT